MYTEWNMHFGFTEHLSGIIRKDAIRVGALSLLREAPFGDIERDRLRLFLPHIRRSISIAKILDDKTVERDRLIEIIDHLLAAVFIVDSTGYVYYMNRYGQQLIETGSVFKVRDGRIICVSHRDQTALLAAIMAGRSGDAAVALTTRDDEKLVATILPLNDSQGREVREAPRAVAAVFIDAAAGRFEFPGEMIGKMYKLTGAELQLLLAIVRGTTLNECAERFGVSIATVKTHLQRIFAKTETSRQAELVRKIGQLSPMIGR
jgi:DNA-binding CsgD family transcriptional regulator